MRAEGETTVEERPFISSELVVMSIFIFSLFDSSFSLTAQKRPCRIEVSVGAAGLACFPGCGRREEGTGRMMVYLDFICWCYNMVSHMINQSTAHIQTSRRKIRIRAF